MIHIRPARAFDAAAMAALLNDIIAIGGTTAMTRPVTGDDLRAWMTEPGSIWHLAEDDAGAVLGFQWVHPHPDLPPGMADIASFVDHRQHGLGIGTRLFDATRQAARAAGYTAINATIRADNASGLTYYRARGFEVWGHQHGVVLDNGQTVDRVMKRLLL